MSLVSLSNFDIPSTATYLHRLSKKWAADPILFATSTFSHTPAGGALDIDPQQARILNALSTHDRVAVRTGRGVGKTASAAIIAHWWLATRYPALVVTSAGTWNHLEEKLWPEIRLWSRHWTLREAFEYQQMGIYSIESPDGLRAVASSSDRPENVEGYHSPHLLLLIDEAKGMPDEIYAALLASLTSEATLDSSSEQKVIALSTPPLSRQGWFAQISSSSSWYTVHISGLDSPRVSPTYVREILETFGESSPEYQSYVLGNIPDSSSETVISLSWFEAAQELSPCSPKHNTRRPVITCDVAREGDDLCTFGLFDRASFTLVRFEDGNRGWIAHSDLMQVVARCVQAAKLHPTAAAICIDDTGLGGGVTDRLREIQSEKGFPSTCSIIPVKFGSRSSRDDRFKQKKDELWWAAREAVRTLKIALPSDDEVREWGCPRGSDFKLQMTSALYEYDSSDRIDVLDKRVGGKEKTKSLPTKSPDLAHAFILGVRYYLRQGEMIEEVKEEREGQSLLYAQVQKAVKKDRAMVGQAPNPYARRR